MLDLSAAFAPLMLEPLSKSQGIGPSVVKWFESDFKERTLRVVVENSMSDRMALGDRTVQGSDIVCRLNKKRR